MFRRKKKYPRLEITYPTPYSAVVWAVFERNPPTYSVTQWFELGRYENLHESTPKKVI